MLPKNIEKYGLFVLALGWLLPQRTAAQDVPSGNGRAFLAQAVPAATAHAALVGRMSQSAAITLALTLPLRNPAILEDLLRRLSDPADPAYSHYLTPAQFTAQFGPTADDYAAVADYARAQGLTVTGTHANRLLLDVTGTAKAVEMAFNLHLNQYAAPDGHVFHAPDAVPSVPLSLENRLSGVVGLTNAAVRRRYAARAVRDPSLDRHRPERRAQPQRHQGGLQPQRRVPGRQRPDACRIEYDGYKATDINAYEHQFSLPAVPLQNVLLDTASGQAGVNADEVTLDIELRDRARTGRASGPGL